MKKLIILMSTLFVLALLEVPARAGQSFPRSEYRTFCQYFTTRFKVSEPVQELCSGLGISLQAQPGTSPSVGGGKDNHYIELLQAYRQAIDTEQEWEQTKQAALAQEASYNEQIEDINGRQNASEHVGKQELDELPPQWSNLYNMIFGEEEKNGTEYIDALEEIVNQKREEMNAARDSLIEAAYGLGEEYGQQLTSLFEERAENFANIDALRDQVQQYFEAQSWDEMVDAREQLYQAEHETYQSIMEGLDSVLSGTPGGEAVADIYRQPFNGNGGGNWGWQEAEELLHEGYNHGGMNSATYEQMNEQRNELADNAAAWNAQAAQAAQKQEQAGQAADDAWSAAQTYANDNGLNPDDYSEYLD